jgi:hypothetical protein
MAPSRYPNRHVGIYQDATDDSYEDLKFYRGHPIKLDHEIRFIFDESPLHRLTKLGCLWTNINPPLVNREIGDVLIRHAEGDVQLLKAHIIAMDGRTDEFSLLNITSLVHCLDYERSVITSFFSDGMPEGIRKLRFKPDSCMNGHNLARLEAYCPIKLVSENLYQALSKLKYSGLHFELDSNGDGKRV